MGHVAGRFRQPPGDRLAHGRIGHGLEVGHRAERRARYAGGARRKGRRGAGRGGFDVAFNDAAARTGAGDGGEVEPLVRRQAPGQRAGDDARAVRHRSRGRPGRRLRRRGGYGRGGFGRDGFGGCRSGGRSDGDLVQGRGVLAVFQQQGDDFVDGDVVGAFGDQDFTQLAFFDGFDFHGRLVGFDLGQDVAAVDGFAFLLDPLGQFAVGHGRRQGGHENLYGHRSAPSPPYR